MDEHGIQVKGILHIGAHTCEELDTYISWGITQQDIIWVDALDHLTQSNRARGILNCYTAVLDEDEGEKIFHVTNNGASSSLLELGTHITSYPYIHVVNQIPVKTQKLSTFIQSVGADISKYNIWNFDIQGSELHVLRGSKELLQYADCIYIEVNFEEVYKGCGLVEELDVLLKEYGLERVSTARVIENWGDAIYVRTKSNNLR